MIFCKFCAGKNQKQYLYLACKHLSCLSCAFLRTDFSSQEIQCCNIFTKIDQNSMETIIRSKRHIKNFQLNQQDNKFNYVQKNSQQAQPRLTIKKQQPKIETKENQQSVLPQKSNIIQKKQSLQPSVSYLYQSKKQSRTEDDQVQIQNILMKQLEVARKYFQLQRQNLKQRQQASIRDIISVYESQRRNIQQPITPAVLQKFSLLISRKVNYMNQSQKCGITARQSITKQSAKDSTQSYDHILKRLEMNQMRMKQKIQKHMDVLY